MGKPRRQKPGEPKRMKGLIGKGRSTDPQRDPYLVPIPGDYATAPRTNATGRTGRGGEVAMLQVVSRPDSVPGYGVRVMDMATGKLLDLTLDDWRAWAGWPQIAWGWEHLPEPKKPVSHPEPPPRADRKTESSQGGLF